MINRLVVVFLVRRNACKKEKLATNAQEKSKSKVTICPATTHILNVVAHLKKRMKSLIPILILIIFTSCDPGVVNKYVVENRTESELKIDSKLKFENRSITEKDSVKNVEINPKTELIIAEYGEIGNAHDKGCLLYTSPSPRD